MIRSLRRGFEDSVDKNFHGLRCDRKVREDVRPSVERKLRFAPTLGSNVLIVVKSEEDGTVIVDSQAIRIVAWSVVATEHDLRLRSGNDIGIGLEPNADRELLFEGKKRVIRDHPTRCVAPELDSTSTWNFDPIGVRSPLFWTWGGDGTIHFDSEYRNRHRLLLHRQSNRDSNHLNLKLTTLIEFWLRSD